MAACIKIRRIIVNSLSSTTELAVEPTIIPLARIDEARRKTIYDPGLGRNREATEIRKVNGEFVLADQTLLEVQRMMEGA